RIGRVLEEQPPSIGQGACWVERCMAQLVEPIGWSRKHRAMVARGGRGAAEFTNRHRTAPGPVVQCSSLFFFHHSVNRQQDWFSPFKWRVRGDSVLLTGH